MASHPEDPREELGKKGLAFYQKVEERKTQKALPQGKGHRGSTAEKSPKKNLCYPVGKMAKCKKLPRQLLPGGKQTTQANILVRLQVHS